MIKINLFLVGNLKEKFLKDAEAEYFKRLSKYASLNKIEIEESKITSFENEILMKKTIDEEGAKISKLIKPNDFVILLDLRGKEMDSILFANKMNEIISSPQYTQIDFVIGGTLGVSDELRKRSNLKLKLSDMTFTHQLTRIILLEQIYRAFKINNNESYHH